MKCRWGNCLNEEEPHTKSSLVFTDPWLGGGKEGRARRRKVLSQSICVSAKNPNKEAPNGRAWARNTGVCVRIEAWLARSGEGGAESQQQLPLENCSGVLRLVKPAIQSPMIAHGWA